MAMYLAATILDEQDAETAYRALKQMNLKSSQLQLLTSETIAKRSYYDPNQDSRKQVFRMLTWLVPFGFFAGFAFNRITDLTIINALNPVFNGVIGGLMGAGSGAMGAVFIGGGTKVIYQNPDEWTYERRVEQGKNILIVTGTDVQIRQVNRQLRSRPYESIQIYEGPTRPLK